MDGGLASRHKSTPIDSEAGGKIMLHAHTTRSKKALFAASLAAFLAMGAASVPNSFATG
jgi:hypothetical protein